MFVTVTSARKDVGTLIEQECTLEELIESCTTYEAGEKDGEAIIPGRFHPCPEKCNGTGWDCGGGRDHRLSRNVYEMHALGIDIDDVSAEQVDKITDSLEARGLTFIAWSTHSNAPPAACRIRLLFPFATPMPLVNPRQWSAVAWPALVKHLGLPVGTDFSCRNPDRIYYLPRIPSMDAPHAAGAHMGQLLDWQPIVGEAIAAQAHELHAVESVPDEDLQRPVDVAAVRALLEKISTSVYLKRALKGEAPTPPPDRRAQGDSSRREAWRDITVLIANAVEGWEASSVLLDEFIRPAWRAEVNDSPQDHTAWEKIEELFASARASAPTYKADKRARERAWHVLSRGRLQRRIEQEEVERAAPVAAATSDVPSVVQVPVERPERPLTDQGNAERFVDQHANAVRYVMDLGMWLRWDGKRWEKTDDKVVLGLARHTARDILKEVVNCTDDKKRDALRKWQHASEGRRALESMCALSKSFPAIHVGNEALDADPLLFNATNGTIDLRTGQLRPHSPADLITKLSPVAYYTDVLCPAWEQFLARVVPSPELRAFIQRAIGYGLTGMVSEQVLFFLYGSGANGKSTLLTAIQHVLGDYATQGSPDLLLAQQHDPHPTSQAALRGARFVVCSEVEQGRTFAEVQIKQLTGGDKITARFMRQDFFEFAPTHKIFLAANHKPRVRGTDHAIWRRLQLVPFEQTINEAEKDPQLGAKLKAEAAGILAWAVRGCVEWQRMGIGRVADVVDATAGYREDQDSVALFIADICEQDSSGFASSAEIYRSYVRWCESVGEKPWTGRALSNSFIERGYVQGKRSGVRGFQGIKVRSPGTGTQIALAVVKGGA